MVAPPPSTVPAPPVVVEEAPMRPGTAPSDGAGDGARPSAGRPRHSRRRPGRGDGHRRGRHRPIDWGGESTPVGPTMAEEVTVLPPVTIAAAPVEDAAAPTDLRAGSRRQSVTRRRTVNGRDHRRHLRHRRRTRGAAGRVVEQGRATRRMTPPETTSPAPEVPITDPPAVAPPPTSADGGGATTVPHKPGPKAAPTDDEGGDRWTTIVVTLNPKADSHANRPVSSS